MHTTKQDNHHKAHPTECETCGRKLPKRAFRRQCATCIKTRQHLDLLQAAVLDQTLAGVRERLA